MAEEDWWGDDEEDEEDLPERPAPPPSPNIAPVGTQLVTNATGPLKAQNDAGSVEMHPLPDQIAADRYINSKAATIAKGRGWKSIMSQGTPPGST